MSIAPFSMSRAKTINCHVLRSVIESLTSSEDDIIAAMQHMARNGQVEAGWDGWAACHFSITCLEYLVSIGYEHKYGFPAEHAAEHGHVRMLRFLHQNGWPIDHSDFWLAIWKRHYDCASYLHDNGYCCYTSDAYGPYGEFGDHVRVHSLGALSVPRDEYTETLRKVVRNILVPKWRAITRMLGIAMYWHSQSGITAYAEDGVGRKRDLDAFQKFASSS